jgi:hypothetical protein
MEGSAVMLKRIREQLDKQEELKASGYFSISAMEIRLAEMPKNPSVEQQVERVAARVTEMSKDALGTIHGLNRQFQTN